MWMLAYDKKLKDMRVKFKSQKSAFFYLIVRRFPRLQIELWNSMHFWGLRRPQCRVREQHHRTSGVEGAARGGPRFQEAPLSLFCVCLVGPRALLKTPREWALVCERRGSVLHSQRVRLAPGRPGIGLGAVAGFPKAENPEISSGASTSLSSAEEEEEAGRMLPPQAG